MGNKNYLNNPHMRVKLLNTIGLLISQSKEDNFSSGIIT